MYVYGRGGVLKEASGGAAIVFSAVPVARRYHTLPESLPLTLSLVGNGPASLSVPPPLQCDYLPLLDNLTITIANCSLCDPSSLLQGGCVPQGPSVCVGQQLEAPGEAEVQVLPVTPHANASNVTYLEVIHWSDAAFPTQTGGEVEECAIACSAAGARVDLCSNTVSVEVIDPMLTFWCYLLVRVLNGFTLAASFTLFDGAAMAILKEHSGDYGLQRLYGNLGAIFLTPISGLLIDRSSEENGDQDYRPAFYLYCALKVVGAVVILFLDLDFRKPSNKVLKDFRGLLKKPEILAFLVVMLISGICFGVLDTFLFWLLQDLGAKKYLMGITVTVGSLAGIPILVASGSIFKKLGLANTIILGFAFYVFRMLGYSFITNPWWCMPFEALECFTVSLMSAAAVSYAADLATPATLATLQGVYGGLYYGVGRGLGSLVGGFLIGPLGVRNTFRIMALVCAVTCIVYFILNRLFFVKAQEERKLKAEKEKKDEKEAVTEERSTDKELGSKFEFRLIPSHPTREVRLSQIQYSSRRVAFLFRYFDKIWLRPQDSTSAMMPFLTLHARSLGILEMELGIVFAVNAVFTILVPTPAGILADKIGNFKVFLSFMMAASGGAALVFSAVPVARRYHNLPESLPLTLSLVDDGLATLSVPPPLQCDYLPLLDNLTITIANCSLCDPGRPTFYLYCGLKVLAAVVILFLDLDFRQPSSRVLKDFRSLLKKPEILSFLIVMLIAGTCFGVLDTFLFWLLQDLGAQKYLMGITVTVGFSAGVPVLVASGYIFKRLGLPNTIVLGFAVYVVRMLGYSFITNPWWCMPFEALECFTVSLMSAAAVSYAADLATPATLTTLQGLYGGIYHGVGRGLGSLVSGFLMAPLGLRNVFRVLALLCGVTGVLYFTTNCLFFRKLQKKRKGADTGGEDERGCGQAGAESWSGAMTPGTAHRLKLGQAAVAVAVTQGSSSPQSAPWSYLRRPDTRSDTVT
ncbi:Major facilitator superfamily domain-containing protein 6 [Portunus trituberculatus]|uniref:Major facilitator superfamily domain-containing protein 6 n=1 Tax=Portunus trituberculatus TaxID=210409 RepID=A0A5B7CMA0_PORTR|nr:Major facilitator superfamily domain-containing protein 6 [Portunus trituberculatus]